MRSRITGWVRRLTRLAAPVAIFAAALALLFIVLRLRAIETRAQGIAELSAAITQMQAEQKSSQQVVEGRLLEFEKTIYGELEPQIEAQRLRKPQPGVVERWQRNRDADIQKRLTALERRLLAIEPAR